MLSCNHPEQFFANPYGRWLPIGSGLIWCHSRTLFGVSIWGRPGRSDAETLVRAFDAYDRADQGFDFLQDGRELESIDPAALEILIGWLRDHLDVVRDHVGRRVALMPRGMPGLTLAGIQVALGLQNRIRVAPDAPTAFRMLLPEGGDALCEAIEKAIMEARALTGIVVALRSLLTATRGSIDLDAAAKALGVSSRTLQRELASVGVSFRSEQADVRFRCAEELLRGDDKLATIAEQLGLRTTSLTQLTRERTGLTPAELRERLRSA